MVVTESYLKKQLMGWVRDYFLQFASSEERVGIEVETIGVRSAGEAIAYHGDNGIAHVLEALSRSYGWTPIMEDAHLIGLHRDKAEIHLEPGGQIEYCSTPQQNLCLLKREIKMHYQELLSVNPGIHWLELGYHPYARIQDISWVPKKRYAIMREYLPKRATLPYQMMKKTASIQANFDYANIEDAFVMLRLALALSPIVAACFHNSPFSQGKDTGILGMRSRAWMHTDPERCGLVRAWIEAPDLEHYVDYILHMPLMFIVRSGKWIPAFGKRCLDFLREGLGSDQAEVSDMKYFLNTIFTEARLKPFVEIRCLDRNPLDVCFAFIALWKGLLYDPLARDQAWGLVRDWDHQTRLKVYRDTPIHALNTPVGDGRMIRDYAKDIVQLSEEGLRRLKHRDKKCLSEKTNEEIALLDPLKRIVFETGLCPAEEQIKSWHGVWNQNMTKLIRHNSITV
ncbi:MAG: glutamate-cysteine ligase family protein [Chlamydiota bacterium]|nr:glutamate-cysteine ligase family protein [Chlamydiota bacterium]